VIAERTKSKPDSETAVAVDLLTMAPVKGVHFIQGNIEDELIQEAISEKLDY